MNGSNKYRTPLLWLAAILYMALIFYLSSRPSPEIARSLPIFFKLKLIHMIEFGFLSFLFFFAVRGSGPFKLLECVSFAIVATLLYGAIDEFHQVFVPSRTASLADLFANGVGAGIVQAGLFLQLK